MELVTSNAPSAKQFYSTLLGWHPNDQPMGPDAYYTMLEVGGKSVGALYSMDKDQLARGIPSQWNAYVAVANVDDATKKAESLGATIVLAPFDVMDVGRMSVINDPTGAKLSLWQPKLHQGAQLVDDPGAFCWYELQTTDPDRAKEFYTMLFGWETGGNEEYIEWKKDDKTFGGMMKIKPEWGPVPPHWLSYVNVPNVEDTTSKAKTLGANVFVPPMEIPNTGKFSILADPQGAVIALYQPTQRQA
jgi:predicted enzyme related to lactoylglutathione lyase